MADLVDGILAATHSACGKICVFRVKITWSPATWDQTQSKQSSSSANPFPTPSFRFSHLNIQGTVNFSSGSTEDGSDEFSQSAHLLYGLTRLDIIPGQLDNSAGLNVAPTLIAVYTTTVHAMPETPEQQRPASVIVRWQLEMTNRTFHPKFDEVIPRKSNQQPKV